MNKDLRILIVTVLVITLWACSRKPYADTNKSYQKQAKAFAETLKATPEQWISDSIK